MPNLNATEPIAFLDLISLLNAENKKLINKFRQATVIPLRAYSGRLILRDTAAGDMIKKSMFS